MTLRFTHKASRQIDSILTSLQSQSPVAALQVRTRLLAAFELLQFHPQAGRPTNRARVRRFVIVPYPYVLL